MDITVFGDSILLGVLLENGRYRMERSWERRLAQEHALCIRNRAHFGNTLGRALAQIERDCASGGTEGGAVVIEFGGNDCDYDWAAVAADPEGEHVCKTPPERFAALYRQALRRVAESGREPVALTLPPIHSRRYLDHICRGGLSRENILHWLGDVDAIYRWQRGYSEAAAQIAGELGVRCIDLRRSFLRDAHSPEELLCEDGIHPSLLGQGLIFDTLTAALGG